MAEIPKGWEVQPKSSAPAGWETVGKYKTEADDLGDTAAIAGAGFLQGGREGANVLGVTEGLARIAQIALPFMFPGLREVNKAVGADKTMEAGLQMLARNKEYTDPVRLGAMNPVVPPEVVQLGTELHEKYGTPEKAASRLGAEMTPLRKSLAAGTRVVGSALPTIAIPGMASASGLKSIGLSALGAGAGQAIGGDLLSAILSMAAPLAPQALAATTRGAIRGTRAPQMQDALDDARLAGTTPSVGQATGSTALNRLESTVGRVGGPAVMKNFSEKQTAQMSQRTEEIASRFSPKMEDVTAGKKVLEGLTGPGGFVQRSGDKAAKLYSQVDKAVPENAPITMANTIAYLTDRTKINPMAPATSAELNSEAISRLSPKLQAMMQDMSRYKGNGTLPYGAVKEMRTSIGQKIDDSLIAGDITQKEARALYSAVTSDIESSLQGPALQSWQRANRFYKARMDHIENVVMPFVNKNTPEQVISALETNAKQGSTMIKGVMSSLKPDDRNVVTAMFIRKMGEATPGAQTAAGTQFSIPQFLTRWNRIDDGAKRVMFDSAGGRDLRAAMDALAKTAERVKRGSQVLQNASGTANAALMGAGLGSAVVATLTGNYGLAGGIAGTMALGNVTARMMTSPKVVRWLARSTGLPPQAAITSLDQLILKTTDPALKGDLEAFKAGSAERQ